VESVSNNFDDIIDKIRKHFDFKSDAFDVDFLVFPESTEDMNLKFGDENVEGFKVSYHFEPGMEKPEIKIEGDFDERKLNEYLEQFKLGQSANVPDNFPHVRKDEVDARKLSLNDNHDEFMLEDEGPSHVFEPDTEINDLDCFTEIILEVPGIEEKDISMSFDGDGSRLSFFAQNQKRRYHKVIQLPFKASENNFSLKVNNGLVTLKINCSEEA
jgi:HSP20 family molecular chaperone IbpA